MKKLTVILALLFMLVTLAVIFFGRHKVAHSTAPDAPNPTSLPSATSTAATSLGTSSPSAPQSVVAIQDGKTLDFSSGKPVLKDSADEKAIIEQSVKEMNEAAAGVTFGPAPKPPAPDPKRPTPQK
jgi:hypothetical protein